MRTGSLALSIVVFSAIFTTISFAQQTFTVGVSPGSIDLGEVEKGSTKLVKFYIITPSEETLLVELEPERVLEASLINDNSSEEDPTNWVKIINNPVELEPSGDTLETTAGLIRGSREVSFLIEVPEDAEPGRHLLNIKPVPMTTSETIGTVGSRVVAITSIKILLNVTGSAVRKGVVLDVETGKYDGDRMEVNTYFQNTGTVTVSANGVQKVYDSEGNLVREIKLPKQFVEPKEIKVFRGTLPTDEMESEDYDVYTVINYNTGEAEKASVISIAPTAMVIRAEGSGILLTVAIVVIIFVVSIIIYRKIQ